MFRPLLHLQGHNPYHDGLNTQSKDLQKFRDVRITRFRLECSLERKWRSPTITQRRIAVPAATNSLVIPLDTAPSCLSGSEDWLVKILKTTTLYINLTLRKGHISARAKGSRIDMKFAALICFFLGAILLVSGAHPVAERLQQHQISYPESQRSSSINSDDSGSSVASASSRFAKARVVLDRFKLKSSTKFQCHSYRQDNTLSELALDVADLLRRYRDQLFVGTGRIPIDTCHAGYGPHDISPSIILTTMNGRQADVLKELLNNLIIKKFPSVKIVSTRDSIALVHEKGMGIRRRATV
ncbi:MAG: hypothetical protein LQ339_005514 [Xanthoria mediterranea]|nr:MAG: hypothetical protein LQ339_005514 [Xanthoria mediterranea]